MAFCFLLCCLLVFVGRSSVTAEEEPMCTKFMYDKQMIETMVRMEAKMEQWNKERKTFEEHVLSILDQRKDEMDEVLNTQIGKLEKERTLLEENISSILENRREEMNEVFHTQNGKLEKEMTLFEDNVSSILEHRREEMNEVFRTQNGKLEKEMTLFEDNVSSILEHRREEMDEVFHTQNGKLEKEMTLFEDNVSSILEHRREEMNEAVHTQNDKLEKLVADFYNVRDDLGNRTTHIETVVEKKVRTKVAFSAYTSSPGSYPVNKVLIFPYVILNKGEGYNTKTGKFTAPISGLYFFHAHICHKAEKYMVVSIVHASKTLAITTEYENSGNSCSSVSPPALVNAGENVFIKSSYSESMLNADRFKWPSFSGFLVN